MTGMTYQSLSSRPINTIKVVVTLESDCDWREGEYSMHLGGFIGSLDLSSYGGVDDITLIKEGVEERLEDVIGDKEEGQFEITLEESGEWEGYNWHKWYNVVRVVCYDLY